MSVTRGLPPFAGQFSGDPEEYPNPNAEMAIQETSINQADIDTDAGTISASIFDAMTVRAPGWIAHDANLDVWLIEEFSTVAAEIRQEALNVPGAIFQTYGEEVLGIPVRPSAPAQGVSTWNARDGQGYTIPAGTQLTLPKTGDELIVFEVIASAFVEPGTTQVTGVQIHAVDDGVAGNDLTGTASVVDPLFWVDTIEVTQPTYGGDDGQTLEDYLDLLVMLMRVVALRPILPWDYAVLSLRIPGVGRSIAMDGYEPTDGTWGHARQITLVVTDPYGEPCSQPTKDAFKQSLEQLREVNFIVNVIDAEYEVIDVAYQVTAYAEQDPALVQQLCDNAIYNALLPGNFRLGTTSPAIAAGEVIPPQQGTLPGRQTLHVNDLIGLLDRTRGVDWVDNGLTTLNAVADDFVLGSPITLPRPGTITGVVNTQ